MKTLRPLVALSIVLSLALSGYAAPAPFKPHQRHAKVLSQEGTGYQVSNVRWGFPDETQRNPIFRTTRIDPKKVKEIYYWSEAMPPEWIAAHGMLAFVMEDETGVQAEDGSQAAGFCLSVEARVREDQKYHVLKGLKRTYSLVYQLSTLRDRLDYSIGTLKRTIHQYRLDLSPEARVQLTKNALEISGQTRDDEWYHTSRNSCITNAIKVINTVLEKKRRLRLWTIPKVLHNVRVTVPKLATRYLEKRKVGKYVGAIKPEMAAVSLPVGDPVHHISLQRLKSVPDPIAVSEFVATIRELIGTEKEILRMVAENSPEREVRETLAVYKRRIPVLITRALDQVLESKQVLLPFLIEQTPEATPALARFARALRGHLIALDPSEKEALGEELLAKVHERATEFLGQRLD